MVDLDGEAIPSCPGVSGRLPPEQATTVSVALLARTNMAERELAQENMNAVERGLHVERTFPDRGLERSYLLHVPPSYRADQAVPLVFVFHGGMGTSRKIAKFTGFDAVSRDRGFIVVYPQGVKGHWNDGRRDEVFREQNETIDDVAFIVALLESLKAEFAIDPYAIFATGPSNGGMLSHRLAIEHPQRFAAIASVISSIPEPLADRRPERPVSVLMINGTHDPWLPYDGGPLTIRLSPMFQLRDRGRVISTDATVRFWLTHNGITAESRTTELPDADPDDGCRTERTEWTDIERDLSVVLYKVIGGGHTYPGGLQYMPVSVIGRTSRDFHATEVIWDFFDTHRRK